MSEDDFSKSIEAAAWAPSGQMFILPDDILQNTVKAFAGQRDVGRTATARSARRTGRYLAPANGPDCIETAPGYGDCGLRSLIVNAPRLVALRPRAR